MKQKLFRCLLILLLICGWAGSLDAQRKVEKLGRGVVAVNTGGGTAYISWRLLATDPEGIGFNIYRSIGGAEAEKLNATPITATTDYTDNSASTTSTNSYFVKPVTNGVEGAASKPFTIQGDATAKRYQGITLQPTAYSTSVQHVYPGDLDGDGEYDYVVKRQPRDPANNVLLEAYTREGVFMWRIDLGHNMELGAGTHNPFVVVYDFNGDGKAEVFTRSGELTVFADGKAITDANGGNNDGVDDYRTLPPVSDMGYMLLGDNCPEYLSMVDGLTGKELARREWIDRGAKSTWTSLWGDNYGHRMNMNFIGVAYLDGVNPSIVTSRGDGGIMDIEAYDFDGTNINSRWTWSARTNTAKPAGQTWRQFHESYLNNTATKVAIPTGYHWADFHNIRVADLDGDGKDEISWGVNAMDDNGTPLYFAKNDIGHGDRFVISDLDPDRPGLECYAIQQAASTLAVYYDAKTGERIKTWSAVPSYDVGRGDAADIDPNVKGCELWSYAHSTVLNCKGDAVPGATSYPAPALTMWWDGDLQREILSAADGNGYNPIINKWNPSTNSAGRLLSLYSEGGQYSNKIPYGGRPALYSDILGDWREEIFCMNSDSTEMRIFSTWTPASTRIYCLMQNPEYRSCANIKGYMTSTEVDYYLGGGMTRPPMPPVLTSNTQWKGGANGNAWDVNTTSNWLNNATMKTFSQGDTVLFDISGKANNTVNLTGDVQPSQVWVSSPADYTFSGTGSITGTASVLKTGYGALTLANTNSYAGKTTVDQGALIVNGVLSQSPVWVNRQAVLGGTGTLTESVTLESGAILSPAKSSVAGTLKFAKSLTIPVDATYQLDMSDDATGLTRPSDSIKVNGDLTLAGTLNIRVNQLNGKLAVGNYPILTYTGAFTGTLSNIVVTGINDNKYSVVNTGNAIVIKVEASRDPGNIVWSGSNSNWDLLTTQSWSINGSPALFATGDSVFFDATGKANSSVILTGTLNIGKMVVDASENDYSFSGTGSITGTGGITKSGKGKLTLSTSNAYTGKTIINGGALEINTLANIGLNSSIGAAASTDPLYLQLTDSRLRYAGTTQQSTDRGITITGTDTIETANSAGSIVLGSPVAGTGKLVKTGAGKLIFNGVNTYSGYTVIKEGAINFGNDNVNSAPGTISLEGGTLTMTNTPTSYTNTSCNYIVPTGCTGTINADSRIALFGTLTGGGTLNWYIPSMGSGAAGTRTELKGNWSAFTGTINVTASSAGGDFRIVNSYGYANAALNLGAKTYAYHTTSSTAVAVGEVSGVATSYLSGANWTIGARNTDATFAGTISGTSTTVTKTGTGTWTLSGASTHTNATTINQGKILLLSPGYITGPVVVNNSGAFGGTGMANNSVTVASGGIIAPGTSSVGTLIVGGALTLNSGSTTNIKISRLSNTQDLIQVTGAATLAGTLNLQLLDGAFAAGDAFKVIQAGSYSGTFSSIVPAVPGAGLNWDMSTLATDGTIRVASITTGVNSLQCTDLTIYPNPVSSSLNIALPQDCKSRIEIFSVGGVKQMDIQVNGPKAIDVSALSSGAYTLKVVSEKLVGVGRFIKQ